MGFRSHERDFFLFADFTDILKMVSNIMSVNITDEMNKFCDKHKLPRMTQEETENQNSPIPSKAMVIQVWFRSLIASATPGNLSGTQIHISRSHPRLTESETQTVCHQALWETLVWIQLRLMALIISNHPHEPDTHCWGIAVQVSSGQGPCPRREELNPKTLQGQERTNTGLPHTVVKAVHCTSTTG